MTYSSGPSNAEPSNKSCKNGRLEGALRYEFPSISFFIIWRTSLVVILSTIGAMGSKDRVSLVASLSLLKGGRLFRFISSSTYRKAENLRTWRQKHFITSLTTMLNRLSRIRIDLWPKCTCCAVTDCSVAAVGTTSLKQSSISTQRHEMHIACSWLKLKELVTSFNAKPT